MKQEQYKMVGVDADGQPLYQKIEAESAIDDESLASADQPITQNQEAEEPSRLTPSKKIAGLKAKVVTLDGVGDPKKADYLYAELDPALVQLRHERSQEQFPEIKFLEKEFVLNVVHRHPIGIVVIWAVAGLIMSLLVITWAVLIFQNSASDVIHQELLSMSTGGIIIGSIVLIALMFAVIFARVYRANKLIITTERVVQIISNSLFDTKRQTIDLGWIEDVSYHQKGFFASTIGYGSVRLSTIGDETTYYFVFAPSPQKITAQINEVVFAIKNERALTLKQINQDKN